MRLILTTILLAVCTVGFAQNEQISGRVINRTGNSPIQGANVRVSNNVDQHNIQTDELGQFTVPNLYTGAWRIVISAEDFSNYETPITLHAGIALNLGNIFMFPVSASSVISDITSFESETSDHVQSGPTLLSASQDVFTSITNFKFREVRFRARGYDWNLGQTYLNGILMNDANTGNSPFSLWGGLNDAMRNSENTSGMAPTNFAAGNVNGLTNVSTRASGIRRGYSINYASSGEIYAHRLGVTWSEEIADDLFLALAGSVRYSPADNPINWTTGTPVQGFSYFLGLEKKFNFRESLAFTFLGSPINRGVSGAAVQEVYDILNDPYYNPNWGFQAGDIRNARMRNSHEPVMMLDYSNRISNKLRVQTALSYRFGKNGYTALDWYDAPDPRPDYYRYLPSFFYDPNNPGIGGNPQKREEVMRGWKNYDHIRHINWDGLYNVNYNNRVSMDSVTINGKWGRIDNELRSKYAIQNRRQDQHDINFGTTVNSIVTDFLKVNGGVSYRWNRTEYFNEMYDLLGGDFWIDIDQFAERDFPGNDAIQNDLNNPNRVVRKGDKYGNNYYAFTQTGGAWAIASVVFGKIDGYIGGDIGFTSFYREGLMKKGLFPENSFGKSKTLSFLSYTAQVGGNYQITGNHIVSVNFNRSQRAPYFRDAFVSPRTRNSTVDNLKPEKIFATDLSYTLRMSNVKGRIAGFYTQITDRSRMMSFYDDVYRAMSNFSLSGVSQRHLGVEAAADVYVWNGFSVKGAVAFGEYIYNSNPRLTQTIDNSNEVLAENVSVFWDGKYVAGTPQLATNLGIEYRAPRNWWAGLDLNYYDYSYVDMNPLRRTDEVFKNAFNQFEMDKQENFMSGLSFTQKMSLNANFGRWKTYNRKYNLGIMLSINNILNNQSMKSGGFEQSRLRRERDEDGRFADIYSPFPSKYYYMNGMSYFLNVFLRF
jgi:hypothetical protein